MAGGVHQGSRERDPRPKTWDLMLLRTREVVKRAEEVRWDPGHLKEEER